MCAKTNNENFKTRKPDWPIWFVCHVHANCDRIWTVIKPTDVDYFLGNWFSFKLQRSFLLTFQLKYQFIGNIVYCEAECHLIPWIESWNCYLAYRKKQCTSTSCSIIAEYASRHCHTWTVLDRWHLSVLFSTNIQKCWAYAVIYET